MTTSLNLFDLKPGKVLLDRYAIRGPHREGGISAAFEVEDQQDGGSREMQVFHAGLFEGPDQGGRFAERLSEWSSVETPGLARLHEATALDDGAVILVTEFPSGPSLRSQLSDGAPMSEAQVVKIGCGLLRALDTVHSAGLIHGDIKPAAIHMNEDGSGMLVDAGITPALWAAKHLGTRTALIGTPFYAPIEQFTGDSPDELSDLYNLSTVMYELLTGVLPWSGKGYIEVFQSKMQERPPRMKSRASDVEVSPELEEVIAVGLCAKRQDRHQGAASFLERLSAIEALSS